MVNPCEFKSHPRHQKVVTLVTAFFTSSFKFENFKFKKKFAPCRIKSIDNGPIARFLLFLTERRLIARTHLRKPYRAVKTCVVTERRR